MAWFNGIGPLAPVGPRTELTPTLYMYTLAQSDAAAAPGERPDGISFFQALQRYMSTYIHTYIHAYIHTYIHTHTHTNTRTHTYICTYIHTYMHAYIHT